MKKITITFALFTLVSLAYAQDTQQNQTGWKINSFGLGFGFSGVFVPATISGYEDLKNSSGNPELFVDPSQYDTFNNYSDFGGNVSPKIYIGITPYSKKKGTYRTNRELRIGIGSNFGVRRYFDFYQSESFVVDTFQSVNGNPDIYADSVAQHAASYSENFFDLNVGISYLFKTDAAKRVHLYAGLGAEYGITLSYFVTVEQYESHSLSYYEQGKKPDEESAPYYYYYYGSEYNSTYSSQKTNMKNAAHFVRTFIPMGINFRISNNNSFFKHVNIFSELSPGVEFQIVPNDQTYVNPYFGVALVGFVYRW
ncbi:MAG: hypothetical protein L3J31_03975 [Bacteroidales bacterium]|nr:hypothetical protein [Bacteroidales bacterium]MCF6341944.1 hypothetical protein [Bacteroidales bacterium]